MVGRAPEAILAPAGAQDLLPSADASFAAQVLGVVVHGDGSSPLGLAGFSAVGVQHPPGALAGALILDADEAGVERQVVPDGVL